MPKKMLEPPSRHELFPVNVHLPSPVITILDQMADERLSSRSEAGRSLIIGALRDKGLVPRAVDVEPNTP